MKIKFPVGTTEENNQLLLEPGFVTFDSERKALRLHDGITQGRFEVVGEQAYNPFPVDFFTIEGDTYPSNNYIAYGNGVYLLGIPNGQYRRSIDNGITWITHETPMPVSTSDLVFLNEYFFMMGSSGNLWRSSDGLSWTQMTHPASVRGCNRGRYLNGHYVIALTQQRILTSTNGNTWSSITMPWNANNIGSYDAAYGDGLYVVPSSAGEIAYSPNLVDWSVVNPPEFTGKQVRYIASNPGYGFIAVATDGTVLRSDNAINWTPLPITLPSNSRIESGGGYFLTYRSNGSSDTLQLSIDGISWNQITQLSPDDALRLQKIIWSDVLDGYLFGCNNAVWGRQAGPITV